MKYVERIIFTKVSPFTDFFVEHLIKDVDRKGEVKNGFARYAKF